MPKILSRILSIGQNKELKQFQQLGEAVNNLAPYFAKMSDAEIAACTPLFKERIANGEPLDDILPEAFAAVREMSDRVTGLRHFDVQVIGAIALHKGMIAEMKTGEGKTLVSTLAGYLNALTGEGVHIVTVNDYLAKRDSIWMGSIYKAMGMTVGLLQNEMPGSLKKPAYEADVTYGTNSEFGFDYLRDNMVVRPQHRVQRGHHYAIVDEVDSILIDEARTPLIISGMGSQSSATYRDFAKAVKDLIEDEDYEKDEAKHTIMATDVGLTKIEKRLGIGNIYGDMAGELVNHLQQALKAEYLFTRDKQYVVVGSEVKIVDEFTGRIMEGRRYSEGLHQAIEAKEGVPVLEENQTLATITLQNYFRLYEKLSGMTGTAMTEDAEFREIYKLPVQEIPPNKPMIRKDLDDQIYRTIDGKFNAVVRDIIERHKKGQPLLVGTVTIDYSERLSQELTKNNIPHEVLNAKFHEKEAHIVAQAGREGAVTIATNMAGRGTDILLGGNPEVMADDILLSRGIEPSEATKKEKNDALREAKKICKKEREHVLKAGGLCVIGTERHESRRIDNQLRGRSGRQGDPGETQFYLSLEDDLMRLFGAERMERIGAMMVRYDMPDEMPLQAKMISRAVENAQRKIEEINFGMRKNVLDYDDVMNEQRKVIYQQRNDILDGSDIVEHIQELMDETVRAAVDDYCPATMKPDEWDIKGLRSWLRDLTGIRQLPDFDNKMKQEKIYQVIREFIKKHYNERAEKLGNQSMAELSQQIMLRVIDTRWMSYLQEMDYLKTGIGLRGFGQRDPLVEYKQEAYRAFQLLVNALYEDFLRTILRIQIAQSPQRAKNNADDAEAEHLKGATYSGPREVDGDDESHKRALQAAQRQAGVAPAQSSSEPPAPQGPSRAQRRHSKNANIRGREASKNSATVKKDVADPYANVGRNDPCPCGSGLKFKKCHGKNR